MWATKAHGSVSGEFHASAGLIPSARFTRLTHVLKDPVRRRSRSDQWSLSGRIWKIANFEVVTIVCKAIKLTTCPKIRQERTNKLQTQWQHQQFTSTGKKAQTSKTNIWIFKECDRSHIIRREKSVGHDLQMKTCFAGWNTAFGSCVCGSRCIVMVPRCRLYGWRIQHLAVY